MKIAWAAVSARRTENMAGFDFILCADDYGMTEAVSRGLLEVAAAGRISAASAMASLPDWRRAARDWERTRPSVDLGLHVTLTVGAPLGAMPRLAPGGELPRLGALAAAALARRLPRDEIEAEIGRQIDAFCDATGAAPTHVDGHQHVHVLPGVRGALFAALARRDLLAVPVRDSSDAPARIARRRAFSAKAMKVNALAAGFRGAARRAGHTLNQGFAGYSDFSPERYDARQFGAYLTAPGPRHLVMCHPGRVDDALRRLDPVREARERERAFFLSDEFADLLAARGARLARHAAWLTRP
ncbi:MAG TPA: ChbG/HpnK family deacetylase [Rhodoblastus sp.]|nr:ChbG/HpnK family deacetylase [Rhodoblastus sp.]